MSKILRAVDDQSTPSPIPNDSRCIVTSDEHKVADEIYKVANVIREADRLLGMIDSAEIKQAVTTLRDSKVESRASMRRLLDGMIADRILVESYKNKEVTK